VDVDLHPLFGVHGCEHTLKHLINCFIAVGVFPSNDCTTGSGNWCPPCARKRLASKDNPITSGHIDATKECRLSTCPRIVATDRFSVRIGSPPMGKQRFGKKEERSTRAFNPLGPHLHPI
jgi:hypothetical protein